MWAGLAPSNWLWPRREHSQDFYRRRWKWPGPCAGPVCCPLQPTGFLPACFWRFPWTKQAVQAKNLSWKMCCMRQGCRSHMCQAASLRECRASSCGASLTNTLGTFMCPRIRVSFRKCVPNLSTCLPQLCPNAFQMRSTCVPNASKCVQMCSKRVPNASKYTKCVPNACSKCVQMSSKWEYIWKQGDAFATRLRPPSDERRSHGYYSNGGVGTVHDRRCPERSASAAVSRWFGQQRSQGGASQSPLLQQHPYGTEEIRCIGCGENVIYMYIYIYLYIHR